MYDTRRQPLFGHPADSFMRKAGESILQGHLTLLEVMVLKALTVFIVHGLTITADNLLSAYKQVLMVAKLCDIIEFPLSALEKEKIATFLQKLYVTLELLRSFLS